MRLKYVKTVAACFVLLLIFISPINIYAQAPPLVDSLLKELAKAKEDTNKVHILKELGNNVGYYDLNGALKYALEGLELSKKLDFKMGIGHMSYISGITYMDMGDYKKSDSFLTIAEVQYNQLADSFRLYKVANARASWSYMQGNYWLAADYYTKAAEGFDKMKDTVLALISYQNLISVLGQIKNHEKAAELGKKVFKSVERSTDTLQIGYTLQTLTSDLVYLGKYEEALPYLRKLIPIADKTFDNALAAEAYSVAGMYYLKIADFQKAIDYFERAIRKAETLDNKYQLANHYQSLGLSYLKAGNIIQAKNQLLTAERLAKEYNNTRASSNVALSLSEYYKQTGDFKNSASYLEKHLALNDSILDNEARNYASYLETKYETNKKETEILRLQQVEQQKDFALRKRNIYLGIAAGLIITVFIVLGLVRKNYRTKQKLAQQQSDLQEEKINSMEKQQQVISLQSMINGQETERTRIAKDLHDGLGGVFSTVKMHYSTLQQDTPEIKENPLYKKTLDLINNASDELRKVAHNMMPEVLMKVGLVEALNDFANNISSGRLLKITLQAYGMEKRLNSSTEIMLYRIVQELINNIIKHAYATEALIQINREGNRLSLVIEDNGRGFDTHEAEEKRSMGMATVKSRVDYLNGRLSIDSRKDVGTTVMIDLLINE
jgi:two-component system NarL family sensor kinase